MKVMEITVKAGRVFNHPFEDYSNLRPEVQLIAALEDGEDFEAATKQLQAKAEGLVEDHKQHMLESLRTLHYQAEATAEIEGIERGIREAQERLSHLRDSRPRELAPATAGVAAV